MNLPVTTAAVDSDALWRRYADMLFDRALARGEPRGEHGDRVVNAPTTNWLFLGDALDGTLSRVLQDCGKTPKSAVVVRPPGGAGLESIPEASGHATNVPFQLYRLRQDNAVASIPPFAVLSGRAARVPYERLCDQRFAECDRAWDADAASHLDDTQCDPLIVIDAGDAVAMAGLQSRGQSGGLFDLYVRPDYRRRGLGRLMISRVLELAVRSQHLDVFASCPVVDPTGAMLERHGFVPLLTYEVWTITAGPASAPQTF